MNTKLKEVNYYYRGLVESGKNYRWIPGYSPNSENGNPLYPWIGMRACQKEAKANNQKAVFVGRW